MVTVPPAEGARHSTAARICSRDGRRRRRRHNCSALHSTPLRCTCRSSHVGIQQLIGELQIAGRNEIAHHEGLASQSLPRVREEMAVDSTPDILVAEPPDQAHQRFGLIDVGHGFDGQRREVVRVEPVALGVDGPAAPPVRERPPARDDAGVGVAAALAGQPGQAGAPSRCGERGGSVRTQLVVCTPRSDQRDVQTPSKHSPSMGCTARREHRQGGYCRLLSAGGRRLSARRVVSLKTSLLAWGEGRSSSPSRGAA